MTTCARFTPFRNASAPSSSKKISMVHFLCRDDGATWGFPEWSWTHLLTWSSLAIRTQTDISSRNGAFTHIQVFESGLKRVFLREIYGAFGPDRRPACCGPQRLEIATSPTSRVLTPYLLKSNIGPSLSFVRDKTRTAAQNVQNSRQKICINRTSRAHLYTVIGRGSALAEGSQDTITASRNDQSLLTDGLHTHRGFALGYYSSQLLWVSLGVTSTSLAWYRQLRVAGSTDNSAVRHTGAFISFSCLARVRKQQAGSCTAALAQGKRPRDLFVHIRLD